MNTELLREIQKAILDTPTRFDMSDWIQKADESPCGTTACIAGYAVLIDELQKKNETLQNTKEITKFRAEIEDWVEENGTIPFRAQKLLDLTNDQCRRLFHVSRWPSQFWARWDFELPRLELAKIASERIDFFIKTEGLDRE